MIPDSKLYFGLKLRIYIGYFRCNQRIVGIEGWLEDAGLDEDDSNLLEVFYFEG